jgi:heat shock protein HtpX
MRSTIRPDRGLQARMLGTMFLLGAVYAAFVAALLAAGAGALVVVVIAGALFVGQLLLSERLALRAMGARVVSAAEAPALHGTMQRLCVAADMPAPRIAIAQTEVPNAFALGRSRRHATVCVTTGLVDALGPTELEGVLAHELAHVQHRDVVIMTVASFFASIASLLLQFGLFFGGGEDDEEGGISWIALTGISLGVYAVSFFLMQALSRYREYAADRGAAELTGRPSALASALRRIAERARDAPARDLRAAEMNAFFIIPLRGRSLAGLFSTHPPLERRIAALARIEEQLSARRPAVPYRELAAR